MVICCCCFLTFPFHFHPLPPIINCIIMMMMMIGQCNFVRLFDDNDYDDDYEILVLHYINIFVITLFRCH